MPLHASVNTLRLQAGKIKFEPDFRMVALQQAYFISLTA
jgi:hypothetical protein